MAGIMVSAGRIGRFGPESAIDLTMPNTDHHWLSGSSRIRWASAGSDRPPAGRRRPWALQPHFGLAVGGGGYDWFFNNFSFSEVVGVARPEPLATYLNDHLGGAAGAIELLATVRGHAANAEFEQVIDEVASDIGEDREMLVGIMDRLDVEPGSMKQAGARVVEKVMQAKSSNVVTGDKDLSRLFELEALCIGIAGKTAGWLALQATAHSALADVDFDRLIARAEAQRARLEPYRLKAAATTFGE